MPLPGVVHRTCSIVCSTKTERGSVQCSLEEGSEEMRDLKKCGLVPDWHDTALGRAGLSLGQLWGMEQQSRIVS